MFSANSWYIYDSFMKNINIPKVEIFSDGWANPNPGPGWYGLILKCGEHQKDFSQWYKRTTNNRMELMWVIMGLKKLKTKSQVILTTDSQYTINGLQKWWAKKWRENNWFRKWSQKAQNWDLWKILLEEYEKHDVSFNWIKGHTGHPENERCDELATLAMQADNLLVDEWYIEDKPSLNSLNNTPLTSPLKGEMKSQFEPAWTDCKKCQNPLVIKYPKHTKKTLEKQYYYEYYHHCESCKTNYMLEKAKRDIKTLKI